MGDPTADRYFWWAVVSVFICAAAAVGCLAAGNAAPLTVLLLIPIMRPKPGGSE